MPDHDSPKNLWIDLDSLAESLGVNRGSLNGALLLTRANIPSLKDPLSPRRNRLMLHVGAVGEWLERVLPEDALTLRLLARIDDAAREILPGRRDEATV